MHDDVFRMNLILNGGWTKDTMHILVELVDLALQQKAWNKKYGHLSYADRMSYYVRRAERFKNRRGGSNEQEVHRATLDRIAQIKSLLACSAMNPPRSLTYGNVIGARG